MPRIIIKSGALFNGLEVLEVVCSDHNGLGVSEVARLSGLDKGNVHRILKSLETRGYIEQDLKTKRYKASSHVLSLARNVLRGLDIIGISRPIMRELSLDSGESVHLAQRTRLGGVYVAQERQRGRITIETELGASPIIHASATGKSLLCFEDWEVVESLLIPPLTKFTLTTIDTLEGFKQELEKVRLQGFALDNQELTNDVRCAAAPIFDFSGLVIACIGMSGPSSRIDIERLSVMGRLVSDAAKKITIKAGGHYPVTSSTHLQTT
jgi:IclR family acetate operon transcriptional repressor